MRKGLHLLGCFTLVGAVIIGLTVLQGSAWAQGDSPLMVTDGEHQAHIFPTVELSHELFRSPSDAGPLLYHSGGVVLTGPVTFYVIFWVPAHLQNGDTTQMTSHYRTVQTDLLEDYAGHGIDNNNTQYYENVGGRTTYIQNSGGIGHTYTDTRAYPTSGCNDPATPGNCMTDAQIRAEIERVIALRDWPTGFGSMFLLYTSSGEGSCFDSTGSNCAYVTYCAYHSFINGSSPIFYSNEPYGGNNSCTNGAPSPNNDFDADTAASAASHEISETITDPELNAWLTEENNEIGDICEYNYGTNSWDSSKANQKWNGHYYELQMEFDNHQHACVQVGP